MTVDSRRLARLRAALGQVLVVIMINIPSISFGLAFGWVSLTSGGHGADGDGDGDDGGRGAVVAAVTTFSASLVGVPVSAWALARGRKFTIVATSACFVVCWGLKLAGECAEGACGAWGVGARAAAGLGGASAWAVAPLLAAEMCDERWLGAAVSALPLAHNAGVLLMYLAADAAAPRRSLLWWCLGLSALHCAVSLCMPESPSFLAAQGKLQKARESFAFLRGAPPSAVQLAALPAPVDQRRSAWALVRDMLSDRHRRRAFVVGAVAVVGQESCGVLAILQYAERVFVLAQGGSAPATAGAATLPAAAGVVILASPARHAVLLGVVQLLGSALSLYLIERVGRRPLLVWSAALTGGALAAAAALVGVGSTGGSGGAGGVGGVGGVSWAGAALAAAVAADAAGLANTPYAVLADMFHYEYRGCAMLLALAGACAGNALEAGVFPAAAAAGLAPALALAAALTLAYALFAAAAVPETRHRTPEQIYAALCPARTSTCSDCESGKDNNNKESALQEKGTTKGSYVGYMDNTGAINKNSLYDNDNVKSVGATQLRGHKYVKEGNSGNNEVYQGRYTKSQLDCTQKTCCINNNCNDNIKDELLTKDGCSEISDKKSKNKLNNINESKTPMLKELNVMYLDSSLQSNRSEIAGNAIIMNEKFCGHKYQINAYKIKNGSRKCTKETLDNIDTTTDTDYTANSSNGEPSKIKTVGTVRSESQDACTNSSMTEDLNYVDKKVNRDVGGRTNSDKCAESVCTSL